MCNKIVSKDAFMLKYCLDKYISQTMCNEAVDDFLPTLNFVSDWFATSKMIKKFFIASCADDNILFFDEDSGNVLFNCTEMGILNIDLNNVNLDNKFAEDDPGSVRLLAWHKKYLKKS